MAAERMRDDEPGLPEVPEACREYAQSQLDDIEGHLDAMITRIVARIPALQDVADDITQDLIRWLRRLNLEVMQTLLYGYDFDRLGPMIEAECQGRQRLGIDQSQTMRSSRHGQQALLDHVSEHFRGHPREAELMAQIMPRLMEFQHVMTLSVARGYATSPATGEVDDRPARVQLLLELLIGRHLGHESVDHGELAASLGLRLPMRMVTVSTALGPGVAEQVQPIVRMNHWAVAGVINDRVVTLTIRAPNAFAVPRGVVILPEDASPARMAAAVAAAGAAADVALRLGVAEMNAVDAAPFAAVLTLPESERQAYVHSCFGDLPGTARGRSLLSTVSAALTHSRLADAAASLHVHRHTLDYRLRRFSDQTGLDLNDPATRLRGMLGLFLIGLLPAPALPGPPAAPDASG